MTATMAKQRRETGAHERATEKPSAEPGNGGGTAKPISYRPSKEVAEALDRFRDSLEPFPPDKSAVIEKALRDFLLSKGFLKKRD